MWGLLRGTIMMTRVHAELKKAARRFGGTWDWTMMNVGGGVKL
jgi:hypothetical protein